MRDDSDASRSIHGAFHGQTPDQDCNILKLRRSSGSIENKFLGSLPRGPELRDLGLDVRDSIALIKNFVDALCPDATDKEREIILDNIEIALLEGSKFRSLRRALAPQLLAQIEEYPDPVPDIEPGDLKIIEKIGRNNRWENRSPNDKRKPVQWLLDYYGRWLPGLLTGHIRKVDESLYQSFMKEMKRNGLPKGVDIPTRSENDDRRNAKRLRELPSDPGIGRTARKRDVSAARQRASRAKAELG